MIISGYLRYCSLFLYNQQCQNVNLENAQRKVCTVYSRQTLNKNTAQSWNFQYVKIVKFSIHLHFDDLSKFGFLIFLHLNNILKISAV